MAFYIRLENKEDVDFLQRIFAKYIDKLKQNPGTVGDSAEAVMRIYDSVLSVQPTEAATKLGVPQEVTTKDDKSQPEKPKPKNEKFNYNYCPTHPTKALKRAPQTDCEGCWDGYKRLHPLEYDKARRNFDRKSMAI